jgi:hypothetical protein
MHREIIGQVFAMRETYPIINMGRISDEMEKDIILSHLIATSAVALDAT